MKTFKVIATLLIFSMVAVWGFNSAFAFDANDRVTVAQNDLGDALMASYYETDGYETLVQVINTDRDTAIVAKIVFRSPVLSEETLDFMLYLTPGDMWEGVVSQTAGQARIYSTDDSCLAGPGVWATEATPFNQEFFTDKLGNDINTRGHIDVYGAVAYDVVGSDPLDKNALYNIYHFATANGRFLTNLPTDVPNALAGKVTLINTNAQRAELNMTALEDWEQALGATSSGFNFLSIGVENGWEVTNVNTVAEIEAAIAKDMWAFPFDLDVASDVLMVATLPTKWNTGTKFPALTEHHVYTEFPNLVKGVIYQVRNMQENMYSVSSVVSGGTATSESLPFEVNTNLVTDTLSAAISAGFTKGWVSVDMPGDSGLAAISQDLGSLFYSGAPVLTSYITMYEDGQLSWNKAFAPAAAVTYAGVGVRQ